jgi:hypothetical protein
MYYFLTPVSPCRALDFVALQRKTADNFRLAMRAALRNSDFARR